jgi:centrosomal protein CEP76
MIADRLLDSPLHAARFVSLIPFERLEAPGVDKVEVWHSMQSFLSRGCGDSEDHAVLLCNLLLGFGLEAYVCVGVNSEGAHAWVMTRSPPGANGK